LPVGPVPLAIGLRLGKRAYIALLEVVNVDVDGAVDQTSRLVHNPACSPTASPACQLESISVARTHQKLPVLYLLPTVSRVNVGFSTLSCFLDSAAGATVSGSTSVVSSVT
jgi:hypothetical protein